MTKTQAWIAIILMAFLTAGALLYTRLFPSRPGPELAGEQGGTSAPAKAGEERLAPAVGGAASGRADEQLRRDVDQLTRQIALLAKNMDALQHQLNAPARTGPVEGKDFVEEEAGDEADESAPREKPAEQISSRYLGEERDEAWAAAAEKAISTEFMTNPEVDGVAISDIECRKSTCRIAWQFPAGMTNEEAFVMENEFLKALAMAGFNASSQGASDGNGATEGYFWQHTPVPSRRE